jgi:nitroimidazol reductase NimA-like FMN-containing flavoprotein (pyridoxamine 5'-phosphate oxidase superfamily)
MTENQPHETRPSENQPGATQEAEATRELPTHEALALLRESPVGRLAVVVSGRPDIFPVNHVVDRGTIVFRTAHGTKLWGASGQPVAFEVDGYDVEHGEAWSVVVHGRGEVVFRTDEVLDALQLPVMPWQSGPKPEIVRIVPDKITGRRFPVVGGVRTPPPT